jgi:pantoate--beta-alanine ligase
MTLTLSTISELRTQVRKWRASGESIALVPTMGALHAGHLSLVSLAQQQAKRVIVSIFVNPTQFGLNEDYDAYPRPLDKDLSLLNSHHTDAAYVPSVAEMYPAGMVTTVHVAHLSEGLCGATRPGHFNGVATIVTKLLMQAQPDIAVFGEKDFQQLAIIRRLVKDLDIPVQILGAPIARAKDGLALSSRNTYLSLEERQKAPVLYQTLRQLAESLIQGEHLSQLREEAYRDLQNAGFGKIDYVALFDADDLAPMEKLNRPARLLAAAFLGKTRLIDNLAVAPHG